MGQGVVYRLYENRNYVWDTGLLTWVPMTQPTGGGGGGGGAVTVADGADVTQGATADAAVQGDNPGTVSAKLRGLNKSIAAGLAVTGPLTDAQLRASAVPVSAASLPLPANAATSTKQSDGTQKTQVVDGAGAVIGSTGNALDVNIKTPATLPVSVASLPLPTGAATEAGHLATIDSNLALIKAKTDNLDVALSTRTKPADAQHVIIDSSAALSVAGANTPGDAVANPANAVPAEAFLMAWDATNSVWKRVQVDAATGTLKVDRTYVFSGTPTGGGQDNISALFYSRQWTGMNGSRGTLSVTGTPNNITLKLYAVNPSLAGSGAVPIPLRDVIAGVISTGTGPLFGDTLFEFYIPAGVDIIVTSTTYGSGTLTYQLRFDALPVSTMEVPTGSAITVNQGLPTASTQAWPSLIVGLDLSAPGIMAPVYASTTNPDGTEEALLVRSIDEALVSESPESYQEGDYRPLSMTPRGQLRVVVDASVVDSLDALHTEVKELRNIIEMAFT